MRFVHAFGIVMLVFGIRTLIGNSFTKIQENHINPLFRIFDTYISTLLKSNCQRDGNESG